ncbi:MAG: ComEA family DNA-binding protein [Pseudomonadales bacterium]|nr:ComEA family DNA-binding protein [Pseudomonadales bacterium]
MKMLFLHKLLLSEFLFAMVLLGQTAHATQSEESSAEMTITMPWVNINTADAPTLAIALDGVGESRAEDIVAYREQHGEFKSIEALAEVRGIGPATVERNRDRIRIAEE